MRAQYMNSSSNKTKKKIRDEFAKLLYINKSIHKVSVTELVKNADINRSTFYTHYNDVYDVAQDIKNETLQVFFDDINITKKEDIEYFFNQIYKYIKKNNNLFKLMFNSKEVTDFVTRLGNICKDRIYIVLSNDPSIKNKHLLELEVSTLSDGLAMQFIRYYRNDLDISLEDIIECAKIWCKDLIARRCK